jgi:hypothetical protein
MKLHQEYGPYSEADIIHDEPFFVCKGDTSATVSLYGPKSSFSPGRPEDKYLVEIIVADLPTATVNDKQSVDRWEEAYNNFVAETAKCLERINSKTTSSDLLDTENQVEDLGRGTNDIFLRHPDAESALEQYQDLCYCATKRKLSSEEVKRGVQGLELSRLLPNVILETLAGKEPTPRPYYSPP